MNHPMHGSQRPCSTYAGAVRNPRAFVSRLAGGSQGSRRSLSSPALGSHRYRWSSAASGPHRAGSPANSPARSFHNNRCSHGPARPRAGRRRSGRPPARCGGLVHWHRSSRRFATDRRCSRSPLPGTPRSSRQRKAVPARPAKPVRVTGGADTVTAHTLLQLAPPQKTDHTSARHVGGQYSAWVGCATRQPELEPEASHLVLEELTWWLYEPCSICSGSPVTAALIQPPSTPSRARGTRTVSAAPPGFPWSGPRYAGPGRRCRRSCGPGRSGCGGS